MNKPRNWRDSAECLAADPARFDPPETAAPRSWQRSAADATIRTYCQPCPVRRLCAALGEQQNAVGIWGGELFAHSFPAGNGYMPYRVLVEVA